MIYYLIDSQVFTLHTFVVAEFGSCLSWFDVAMDTGMYDPATFCNWGAELKLKIIHIIYKWYNIKYHDNNITFIIRRGKVVVNVVK